MNLILPRVFHTSQFMLGQFLGQCKFSWHQCSRICTQIAFLIYFVNNFISNVTFITDFDWRYTLPQGPINIFHFTDIESIFRTYKLPGTIEISGVFQIPNSFFNITFIGSVAIKTTLTPFLNLRRYVHKSLVILR